MVLPQLKDFNFQGKKVLVRCDLDVPLREQQSSKEAKQQRWELADDERIEECLPTIEYLLEQGVKEIILAGHLGRPEGKVVNGLRMIPVAEKLQELLKSKVKSQKSKPQCKIQSFEGYRVSENIVLLENLRFDPGEENNDLGFAKELAGLGEFYVNEAFAASHREHTSIVSVPKFLPHCAGLHFASEVENLSKVLENPQKPVVFVIGGVKSEAKLPLAMEMAERADWVLIGGTLPKYKKLKIKNKKYIEKIKNIVFANLTNNGFDIDKNSVKKFDEIIKDARTVVWNGPMGKYEDEKWEAGTRKIAEAIVGYGGFEGFGVVGGGDTIAALKKFGLLDKIDYVSTGGGAMLEFLAKGTLPGIKALL